MSSQRWRNSLLIPMALLVMLAGSRATVLWCISFKHVYAVTISFSWSTCDACDIYIHVYIWPFIDMYYSFLINLDIYFLLRRICTVLYIYTYCSLISIVYYGQLWPGIHKLGKHMHIVILYKCLFVSHLASLWGVALRPITSRGCQGFVGIGW